jgi:hypothetical protein
MDPVTIGALLHPFVIAFMVWQIGGIVVEKLPGRERPLAPPRRCLVSCPGCAARNRAYVDRPERATARCGRCGEKLSC